MRFSIWHGERRLRFPLVYGAETPPKSRAEMEALAALPWAQPNDRGKNHRVARGEEDR
jgi:hypothetical protein